MQERAAEARDVGCLTDTSFWLARQERHVDLPPGGHRPPWFDRVQGFLPVGPEATCLEIGVYPGAVLLFLALEQRFHCMGIDVSPYVASLGPAFAAQGVGARFLEVDFLRWSTQERFDFVYSCGFIEHFRDSAPIIQGHWRLVKPGGLMLLSVPTLTPFQWGVRVAAYKRCRMQAMLATHNRRVMSLSALRAAVRRCRHGRVRASSYVNEMRMWFSASDADMRPSARILLPPLRRLERALRKVRLSSALYSPEAFVLVQKQQEAPR